MHPKRIHILPLGGNLASLQHALERLQVQSVLVEHPEDLNDATHLILPGVGHFDRAMDFLNSFNFSDKIRQLVAQKQLNVLGICLGMQLLGASSEEGLQTGLGLLPLETKLYISSSSVHFKSPHNGWNTLEIEQNVALLAGISVDDEFFFLHQYRVETDHSQLILANTRYENYFPSVVGQHPIYGVQFHPEKSHAAGLKLLANFIQLPPCSDRA